MNVGIFAVITLVSGYDEKLPLIEDFRGLIYRSPLLGGLLIFFLASLVGIPFTGGFFGKFYSFSAAVGGGAIWLAIIGLLNSGLAAAYYLRLALVAAQRSPGKSADETAAAPHVGIAVGAALLLAVAATLILGIAARRSAARRRGWSAYACKHLPCRPQCRGSVLLSSQIRSAAHLASSAQPASSRLL